MKRDNKNLSRTEGEAPPRTKMDATSIAEAAPSNGMPQGNRAPDGDAQGGDRRKTGDAPQVKSLAAPPPPTPQTTQTNVPSVAISPVRPPSVSLPKGGGALRPLGETFKTNPSTGTGGYSIPVPAPEARGFSPGLALAYDSGSGNGPFGLGWSLSLGAVTRSTNRRLPQYDDANESDIFVLSGAEDLVPALKKVGESWVPDTRETDDHRITRYRPRTEGGFARVERFTHKTTGEQHWVVRPGDGTAKFYGREAASRVADPDASWRVYSWLLDRIEDDRGNVLEVEYKAEDFENIPRPACEEMHRYLGRASVTNRYPKRIRYGNTEMGDVDTSVFDIVFDYGEHDELAPTLDHAEGVKWPARQDAFSSYRAGFEVRTYRLCHRILVFHTFAELCEPLGPVVPCLVKSIDLTYDETPAVALLKTVTLSGYIRQTGGSYTKQSMPPLDFGYSLPTRTPAELRFDQATLDDVDVRGIGRTAQWVDLDGEGLPGLLVRQGGGFRYKQNLSGGALAKGASIHTEPSIGAEQARIVDVDGSGIPTLARFDGAVAGSFVREDGEWGNFKPFLAVPNVDWSSAKVSMIDLDGDGRDDLLVVTPAHYIWYPSEGDEGFGSPRTFPTSEDPELGPAWWPHSSTHLAVFFADMTGDGQADLVQVTPHSVCYWPNLGHGRFGAKVCMAGSPFLGNPLHGFDGRRIRFADMDGTGTSDLVYFDADGAKIFWNQAGNSFAEEPTVIESFPTAEAGASASVIDAFGRGTAQLVWASANWRGPDDALKAIDVVGETKPYLLTSVKNHLGLETRVAYAPSTKFYIMDRAAGTPWATKLPFPVQVVEEVETYDAIRRHRFVQQYVYHHGAFDPEEREFRGFGRVDTIDTDYVSAEEGKGLFTEKPPALNNERPQPPVLTKTWFHLGIVRFDRKLREAYAKEQWNASTNRLAGPAFEPENLSVDQHVEALRAMRGQALRVEVYGLDGTEGDTTPVAVTETRVRVRQVQPPRGGEGATAKYGVFFAHSEESAGYHYEKNPSDPRVSHTLTLDVDDYGVATREAVVVYGRSVTPDYDEQGARHIVISERDVSHFSNEPDVYRLTVPLGERLYELKHDEPPGTGGRYTNQQIRDAFISAEEQPYETALGDGEKRLLGWTIHTYYDSDGLPGPLAEGTADAMALPYESFAQAFTTGLLSVYDTRVDGPMLVDARYQDRGEDGFWSRSGQQTFDADHFYVPTKVLDPFGRYTELDYDTYFLAVTQITDAVANVVTADLDYRILSPWQLTDANGNRQQVAFDELGHVTKAAVMGKDGSSDGDTLDDPTVKYTYDLDRWGTLEEPGFVKAERREEHGAANLRWLVSYAFFDGAGGIAMTKVMAEPETSGGPVRWVASGRTIVNNKGNPIKQYEPYFTDDWAWEWEEALATVGVTPLLTYDALGRLVKTELPSGAVRRVIFTPWMLEQWDENDTVSDPGNAWYAAREATATPTPAEEDEEAAERTWEHRETPTKVYLDSLGRAFVVIVDSGTELYETKSVLDLEGQVRGVIDALGRPCMTYDYSVDGQVIHQTSIDAGDAWSLLNVLGTPFRSWDALDRATRAEVDDLERVTHLWVKNGSADEALVLRVLYGESYPTPEAQNLRGRACMTFDGAGLFEAAEFDFKGNALSTSRQLAVTYTTEPDWKDVKTATTPAQALSQAALLIETETFSKAFAYDALNRVTSATMPDLSEIKPTYNEAGFLEALDVHIQGASATTFVTNVDYDEKGRRTRIDYYNGTYTEYFYDPLTFRLARLRTKRSADSKRLQDLFYFYDAVGNITSVRDEAHEDVFYNDQQVSPRQDFVYDALYRLIEATGREHAGGVGDAQRDEHDLPLWNLPHPNDAQALRRYTEQYTYDPVGNLLEFFHDAGSGPMTWTRVYKYGDGSSSYANNRLHSTSVPGPGGMSWATYTHDANGNMIVMPHLASIEYTHADQMRMADLDGGGTAYYTYDAGGERALKRIERTGTLIEERIYLGGYEVYRKRDHTGLLFERQTLHVMDGAHRVAMVETVTVDTANPLGTGVSRIRYQYINHLGSAMVECDEDGQVISYEEYHPYGTTAYRSARAGVEVSEKRYRYTGKERDEETGFSYHGLRYYSPWLGRWTSADPTGTVDGPNLYQYARSNPVILIDPTGTRAVTDPGPAKPLPDSPKTLKIQGPAPQRPAKPRKAAPAPAKSSGASPAAPSSQSPTSADPPASAPSAAPPAPAAPAPAPTSPAAPSVSPPASVTPPPSGPSTFAKGVAGFAYGVMQTWTPGGVLMPSPMPKDKAFEFWRGAGQFSAGAVELFAGLGLLGGGGAAAGGGAGAAPFTGGASLVLSLAGAGAVAIGWAAVAQGTVGISAGIATMNGSLSLSTGGGSGSGSGSGSIGGGGTPPPSKSRLVIGGGTRAQGNVRPGDKTLDIKGKANPDYTADITKPLPAEVPLGAFDEVLFERVWSPALTDQAFKNAYSVLKSGGRLEILAAKETPAAVIIERLQAAGFRGIKDTIINFNGVEVLQIIGFK